VGAGPEYVLAAFAAFGVAFVAVSERRRRPRSESEAAVDDPQEEMVEA
jgi:hypothetical protein